MNDRDDSLIEDVTRALDESVAQLDAATLSKLNQARQYAIAESQPAVRPLPWLTAGATAAVAVIAFTAWLQLSIPQDPLNDIEQAAYIATTESLTDEDIEMLYDLDFYAWLLEEEHAG